MKREAFQGRGRVSALARGAHNTPPWSTSRSIRQHGATPGAWRQL